MVEKSFIQYWNNFRQGPGIGDVLDLTTSSGVLYAAYMAFVNNVSDASEGEIYQAYSADGGKTWQPKQSTVNGALVGQIGLGSQALFGPSNFPYSPNFPLTVGWVSLATMPNGSYLMIFAVKYTTSTNSYIYYTTSANPYSGTWAAPTLLASGDYWDMVNNNICVNNGRIIFSLVGLVSGDLVWYYSDNNAGTWSSYNGGPWGGYFEGKVFALSATSLITYWRTSDGNFWYATSANNGTSWSVTSTVPPVRNTNLAASESPCSVIPISTGKLLIIFNPTGARGTFDRSVLQLAKGTDGLTWTNCLTLEPAQTVGNNLYQWSYPSLLQKSGGGNFLVSYYEQILNLAASGSGTSGYNPPYGMTSQKFATFALTDIGE